MVPAKASVRIHVCRLILRVVDRVLRVIDNDDMLEVNRKDSE